MSTARRLDAVAGALAPLLDYIAVWDGIRLDPDVSDFAFGNPQEMPLPGFVSAIRNHAVPLDKDWFAYKRSEPEPREAVAKELRESSGLPFEPEDIARAVLFLVSDDAKYITGVALPLDAGMMVK